MTADRPSPEAPERGADLYAERRRHIAKAGRSASLLTAGDPLADAVIAELDALGAPARQALVSGLGTGLASLHKPPPEAVAALLEQLETTPSRLDPLMLHRGDVVGLSVPPLWFGLCSITSALAYSYASPAVARLPTRTGTPTAMATRQLVENGVWARQTMRPGGLLRGGPGYVATVQVRLRHARMRATALEDWDAGIRGLPISGVDMARTWLGFTLVPFEALAAVGIDISPDDERLLYHYWSYAAHLLGVDESLYGDVVDHSDARRLRRLLDSTTAAPDDDSRSMIAAMIDVQARAMADAPGAVLSEVQLRALIHSVLWRAFGDEVGDRLGLPAPATTELMPLIGRLNREARYWQTFSPASAQAARRRALDGPGPELIGAILPGGVVHLRNAAAYRWSAPSF
ncbi:oxygenase MpaB family protein [Streptomyces phaeochromogenes]|uniref:oxygenase MpaB family protein n=1 Tax=Streptomyces phaeochromogenes TaxID=1923 RepID=UPI003685BEDB